MVASESIEWTQWRSSIAAGCFPVSKCPELPYFSCACLSSSRCSQLQHHISAILGAHSVYGAYDATSTKLLQQAP